MKMSSLFLAIVGLLSLGSATANSAELFCDKVTPGLKRTDAVDCPSKHAWDLFLLVNHPAADPKKGRGIPDDSKKIGDPGTTVVWETWRLSGGEVFLEAGAKPPIDFNDMTMPGAPPFGKVPERSKAALIQAGEAHPLGGAEILFDPNDGIFQGVGGFGESRMNKATYDFVLAQGLYNLNGQQKYALEYLMGKRPLISFPPESMEVKAAWIELTDDQIKKGEDKKYYLADYKGKKYGLVGLHILTKDLPNWFWATFHHKDHPTEKFDKGVETKDVLGPPDVLKGTVWENYKLGGTQIDFVDLIGNPTMLSDAYIEAGFVKSSCISCHAYATASPLTGEGARGHRQKVQLGAPLPSDFRTSDGQVGYVPLDFLFSLPFRAQWDPKQ
ncbi:MAG: hypothetical protein EOQ28_09590 [Mesorhizobium sp.]|uniref:hypothetical protein n=1 Tax=Mesorhizobium sp. TaxID=1871066 RepID=UPI000FE587AA|nr:hypothetical protein [Mesorhizobium sp.]RWA75338.1 MAG: hypothetical protein EOQ28_09590 [Mesorhizobium sp.]